MAEERAKYPRMDAWDPVPGGSPYDIIFGDVQILRASGFTASVGGCLQDNGTISCQLGATGGVFGLSGRLVWP